MSTDVAVIAGELQDLTSTVERVADAIRDQKTVTIEAPAVTVNVPEQPPAQVTVEVATPTVNVEVLPPSVSVSQPQVVVEASKPSAYKVRIVSRDEAGFIKEFVITPMGER